MAEETKVIEQPNSCKIAVNAKGLWSGEVKVYAPSINEAVMAAIIKAEGLATVIAEKNGFSKPVVN